MQKIYYFLPIIFGLLYGSIAIWRIAIAHYTLRDRAIALSFLSLSCGLFFRFFGNSALYAVSSDVRAICWSFFLTYAVAGSDVEDKNKVKITNGRNIATSLATLNVIFIIFGRFHTINDNALVLTKISYVISFIILCSTLIYLSYFSKTLLANVGQLTAGFNSISWLILLCYAFDLNYYTLQFVWGEKFYLVNELIVPFYAIIFPIFVMVSRRNQQWRIVISRQFQGNAIVFLGIGTYFIVVSNISSLDSANNSTLVEYFPFILKVFSASVILYVLVSPRARSHVKIFLVKHFFEHRYDYRLEWIRFSSTIGVAGNAHLTLHERAIRSLADVTDSAGGVFMEVDARGALMPTASWRMDLPSVGDELGELGSMGRAFLEKERYVVDLDAIRLGRSAPPSALHVPEALLDDRAFWILVPLVLSNQLIGIVALGRSPVQRAIDWEDFDLLRVIGQQIAVYLAEAESHLKLEEARRFDEFNRRFAFIIHDIKNIVSQISMLTENAQEHWDNPKFQQSINKTLSSATKKMLALLTRLSPTSSSPEYVCEITDVRNVISAISQNETRDLAVDVTGLSAAANIFVDEERLVFAVKHVVANAFEASPTGSRVEFQVESSFDFVTFTIRDYGSGMSQAFIRERLFTPFASTKQGGFGIGAAEARDIIIAVGGTLDVSSREGAGTIFFIRIPLFLGPSRDGTTA